MFVFYYFSRHDFKHFSATSTWQRNFNLELSFETYLTWVLYASKVIDAMA